MSLKFDVRSSKLASGLGFLEGNFNLFIFANLKPEANFKLQTSNFKLKMAITDDRIRNRRAFRNPILIVGSVMTFFYLCLGTALLAFPNFLPNIPTDFRTIFAGMLMVYGAYRGWRVYVDYFKKSNPST